MGKNDVIQTEEVVQKALSNGAFAVELQNGHELTCYLSGLMRRNYIRIIPGDKVRVEMSPYDLTKGRICYRFRV